MKPLQNLQPIAVRQPSTKNKPTELQQKNYAFNKFLANQNLTTLSRDGVSVLQINLGKLCNQACHHCHVEAGPKRTEIMTKEVMQKILVWIRANRQIIGVVDLTGGAPEMNPNFRYFVDELLNIGIKDIISRCNLTIVEEPGYEYLAAWYAQRKIHVVSSLPCYSSKNVDEQRGKGVFGKSISALQKLNKMGYGIDKDLILDLVYNPNGALLPPNQSMLKEDYKMRLKNDFNIQFNELFALANLPVKRFEHYLMREKKFDSYMQLLIDNFNASTLPGVMCRQTLSIDWMGYVYDCDFNQMLDMPAAYKDESNVKLKALWYIDVSQLKNASISTGHHCFGCTAGSGSSCGGSLS